MDIRPGSTITVEITATPRRAGARKTLTRLFRTDPTVARHTRKMHRQRPSWEEWTRGGNRWHHQMRSGPGVSLDVGAKYSFRATVDALRDLASVKDIVKVTPA